MGYPLYDNRDSLCADVTIFSFNAVFIGAVTIHHTHESIQIDSQMLRFDQFDLIDSI